MAKKRRKSKRKSIMENKKKLKEIASQLRKASAMHKGQAAKIDRMLKSMSSKAKKKNGRS
jgi:hypothetical protein